MPEEDKGGALRSLLIESDFPVGRNQPESGTANRGGESPSASLTLSYGALKLLPFWDPLRGDPRFEKIVVSLAPKKP